MHRQIIAISNSNAYISYRPADIIPSPISGDFNSCETALVRGADFLILSGDFRAEVERIIANEGNIEDLITFFENKSIEWASGWTSKSKASDWVAGWSNKD